MTRDILAEGWTEVPLSEACSVITDGTHRTPTYVEQGVPFLSTANLRPFEPGFDFRAYRRYITRKEHNELSRRSKPVRGDVLVAKCGTIGRAKEVDVDYEFSIFVGVALLRPLAHLFEHGFLEVMLNAPSLQQVLSESAPGSTRRTLTLSALKQVRVLVAPFAEQRRIVEKVRLLLGEVNRAKARLDLVPLILKRFRQSVLAAACSGELTREWRNVKARELEQQVASQVDRALATSERGRSQIRLAALHEDLKELRSTQAKLPEGWIWYPLDALCARITDGTHQPPPLTEAGIPFLLIGNIDQGEVRWDRISKWVSRETYDKLTTRCVPQKGDVLYTAVGATYGQALPVDWDFPFVFQRHIAHLKPQRAILSPQYLAICLNSPDLYSLATDMARGAAQPTVTLTDIKSFPIPLCSMSEQQEIVRRVQSLVRLADTIEHRIEAATSQFKALRQSILSRAFSGELVPTEAELARAEGRTYETAEELLARVKQTDQPGAAKKANKNLRPVGSLNRARRGLT